MGHGSVKKPTGLFHDVQWQLTVMTSIDNVFHTCDNENDFCTIQPLPGANKLHIDEFYIPNRRNILGGIQIAVSKIEAVSFRASTTTTDLEIEAVLRSKTKTGVTEELGRCKGKGDICWPYIRLKPHESTSSMHLLSKKSYSQNNLPGSMVSVSPKGKGKKPNSAGPKSKSTTKLNTKPADPKVYTIEVIATKGWPLPLAQWKRVDEIRNMLLPPKLEHSPKKQSAKEKVSAAKEKKDKTDSKGKDTSDQDIPMITIHQPLPEDAYTELECSTAIGGGAFLRRDDERDLLFAIARRSWESKQPGRNMRGEQIRQEFREDFLVSMVQSKPASVQEIVTYEGVQEEYLEEESKVPTVQGPTPVSETIMEELEAEEISLYYTMPDQLRDKFVHLFFVPICTKEREGEPLLLTPEMVEAAKIQRAALLEAALERMTELQGYNEVHVLGRQKQRVHLLENLLVDGTWNPDLATVLEERDEAIAREVLENTLAAKKKLQEAAAAKKIDTVKKKK